jgi:large subunit ribosomal protein L11
MIKPIIATIKLTLKAGNASPMPPIGPALGQYGIDIATFCKDYNYKTQNSEYAIVPAIITIYNDTTYSFQLKTPPTSQLILNSINLEKGSNEPNKKEIGLISLKQLETIVKIKDCDLNTQNTLKAIKNILGTAISMGITLN